MSFKVFIAESNNPDDFYHGRLDGFAANEVLKVREISSVYKLVFNIEMLKKSIEEARVLNVDIFHLSCHGDKDGIQLCDGKEISWKELVQLFSDFANSKKVLVISSCMGGHQGLAEAFMKETDKFGYICGSTAEYVTFHSSCLAWSILYNVLANNDSSEKESFQDAINKINSVLDGKFVYRRWAEKSKKYLFFPPRAKKNV